MADELKPCPFCESRDVEQRETITDAMVACNNCGGRTGLVYFGASEASNAAKLRELRAAWNTRFAPKADSALVGEPDRNQPHPLSQIWADAFHAWENGSHWDACETLRAALSDRDVVLEEAAKVAEDWTGPAFSGHEVAQKIAKDIRALKGGVDE